MENMQSLPPIKREAPSASRNAGPIAERLEVLLPQNARVLEIASGTGQHGAHFCAVRSDIHWQYTDIDAQALSSQTAYAGENPAQLSAPITLDVTADNWWISTANIDVIYCANMIHIAPWAAALGLAKGAGKLLPAGGLMMLYGPFLEGEGSAPSNLAFDQSLKARNPQWGVRNLEAVKHIFADNGLNFLQKLGMPRDNNLLVFKRTA